MYVKLPLRDLNPNYCSPHLTSIYTCRVIIASKVHGGSHNTIDLIIEVYFFVATINSLKDNTMIFYFIEY